MSIVGREGMQPPASTSRLPVSSGRNPVTTTGGFSTVVPSGIPISRSRILSTSPRSPSNPSFGGSPALGQTPSNRDARPSPRGNDVQSTTPLAHGITRQVPIYDGRQLLSGLRNVSRSVSERSLDRQSVDSVQLALKLAGSSDIDDGDSDRQSSRFLQDEPPPFVTVYTNGVPAPSEYDLSASVTATRSWAAGMTSDIREIDLSNLPDDTLPSEQDCDGSADLGPAILTQQRSSASSSGHAPIRQIPSLNPSHAAPRSDPAISKSSSMTLGARKKPVGPSSARQRTVSNVKASAATPRSSSAQELGRMATSKKPGATSSPSSIGRSAGATHVLTSSTSSREHYPVEAYMVPRIAEYKPANGDWENTVIPTHARGLNVYPTGVSGAAVDDDDDLVTEWTPDGKPIRVVKVSERSAKMDVGRDDSARSGSAANRELVDRIQECLPDDRNPSWSSPFEPDIDQPVLADILQDYEHPESYGTQDSVTTSAVFETPDQISQGYPQSAPEAPIHSLTSIGSLDTAESNRPPTSTAMPAWSSNGRADIDRPGQRSSDPKELTTHEMSDNAAMPSTAPKKEDRTVLSSQLEPSSVAALGPQNSTPANKQNQTSASGVHNIELQNVARNQQPQRSSNSRTQQNGKEEHGGGCRCMIM